MLVVGVLSITLSCLIMAAHLLRGAHYGLVVLALIAPFLLLISKRWVARIIQLALALAAMEWLRTIFILWQERIASGQPYFRMLLILGVVTVITIGSAGSFQLAAMRKRYRISA